MVSVKRLKVASSVTNLGSNSLAKAGVATITASLAPWNLRSAAQIQDSRTGRRAEIYSGKRV